MRIDFDAGLHRYCIDGRPVPSVTQVLEPLNDWDMVPAWRLEAAAAVGSEVHAAVNLLVHETLDWSSLDEVIARRVRGAARYLEQSGLTVVASEVRVGSRSLGVAGTVDLIGHLNNWEYFIDWKCTETVPSTVGAQLAAYEKLHAETFHRGKKRHRTRRLCVRLLDDDFRVDDQRDIEAGYSLFISCLNMWKHRQRKHG